MLRTSTLFSTPTEAIHIKPSDKVRWNKQKRTDETDLDIYTKNVEIAETRIAFLKSCAKANKIKNEVSAFHMRMLLRDIEFLSEYVGKSWYHQITGGRRLESFFKNTDFPYLIKKEDINLETINRKLFTTEKRLELIAQNKPITIKKEGREFNLEQSNIMANGLFGIATSDITQSNYTNIVKYYLLDCCRTSTHLLKHPSDQPREITVILEKLSNYSPYVGDQIFKNEAAHISLNGIQPLDQAQIPALLEAQKRNINKLNAFNNIYIIANHDFSHEDFMIKEKLLQNSFKYIFDTNAQAVTSAVNDQLFRPNQNPNFTPSISEKTYSMALAATYPRVNTPIYRLERLNKQDNRPTQAVIPHPDNFLPVENHEINPRNIRRPRLDKFETS